MRCSINKHRRQRERGEEEVRRTQQVCLIHSTSKSLEMFRGDYKWESIFRVREQIKSDCVCSVSTIMIKRRSRPRALIKFIVPNSIYVNQQAILIRTCVFNLRTFRALERSFFFSSVVSIHNKQAFLISCTVTSRPTHDRLLKLRELCEKQPNHK